MQNNSKVNLNDMQLRKVESIALRLLDMTYRVVTMPFSTQRRGLPKQNAKAVLREQEAKRHEEIQNREQETARPHDQLDLHQSRDSPQGAYSG